MCAIITGTHVDVHVAVVHVGVHVAVMWPNTEGSQISTSRITRWSLLLPCNSQNQIWATAIMAYCLPASRPTCTKSPMKVLLFLTMVSC
jgi:hypothetical protein